MSSLSENIKTVVTIQDGQTGTLLMEEGVLREVAFHLDHLPEGTDLEDFSRALAPLNHLRSLKSSIPEAVTFLELYGVERVEELDVSSRWASHSPYKSLAVPLGFRGQEDIVSLNLHEKAHGPHGLVAGTTGSGKSEILQSYILSLAVNFHPHDVAFLLIDYKGGGMANLFKDLPHLLGTITNLDGAQSMRALTSIKAELKRRQKLFSANEVNHINQYQKKVKLGEATEPMPHLFLISDEFAELKQNQPDFMAELVSTARIGRSLGIHLILATQKPSGVVNDQIWSNSRFKLALKVADRADSQEMLKTPDAADITQAGRAYLQVGNNEVYELFQSAWSGADYEANKSDQGIEDQTIYAINELGQYEILNQDLSGLEVSEDIRQVPTELDAVVSYIHDTVAKAQIPALAQPWLPPLKERISLSEVTETDYQTLWEGKQKELLFTLGMVDLPQDQKQEALSLNLSQDGNLILYGSPGTGKTTFLQSAVMDLSRHLTPDYLHFYLLDFGANGLAPLSKVPHVADRIALDQTEKLLKWMRLMDKEVARRKQLLTKTGLASMSLYGQTTGQVEASLVVVLDSYEAVKGEAFEEDFIKLMIKLSREGLSLGIHVVMTANRQANLRATLYSNFKHQLTLKQHDVSEVRTVVGSTPLADMEDVKGRALIKRGEVDVLQLALPNEVETTIQVIDGLRQEAETMRKAWTGLLPAGIPMVPDELTEEDFYSRDSVKTLLASGQVPLGLDLEEVEAVGWDPALSNLLYLTNQESRMVELLKQMSRLSTERQEKLIVFAPEQNFLPNIVGVDILSEKEATANMIGGLALKISERLDKRLTNQVVKLVFFDFPHFVDGLDATSQLKLVTVLEKGYRVGYSSLIMSDMGLATKLDGASKEVKKSSQALLGMRYSDQSMVSAINKPFREGQLGYQEHYYIKQNNLTQVKVLME